jgi:hypothetical protein
VAWISTFIWQRKDGLVKEVMVAKFDITQYMKTAEVLIDQLENPHHRAILENYRMHGFLELSGQHHKIFDPTLTVEHPVYRVISPERGYEVFDGAVAVRDNFYGPMTQMEATVFTKEQEHLAVADWGLSQEQLIHNHMSGRTAVAKGYEVDDLDATYVEDRWQSAHWEYAHDARLIGEHLYWSAPIAFNQVAATEFLSTQEVRDRLAPLIAAGPHRKP